MGYMKKAVFYARVSSDIQQKERTIESQIAELKKQITASGDVLVKEYIDDGFSGALLNRPAMDQMRRDLKTNIFETIYFWNTDRIARDVTYPLRRDSDSAMILIKSGSSFSTTSRKLCYSMTK